MSGDHAEVRSMLRALSPHVERCTESLTEQAVGNALYGLQGMSGDHAEVRSMLRALSPHIERYKDPLNAQTVGNALYGLQGMMETPDGLNLVLFLVRSYLASDQQTTRVYIEFLCLCQSIAMMLPLFKDHLSEDEVYQCNNMVYSVDSMSRESLKEGLQKPGPQSRSEKRMQQAAIEALQNSNMQVSQNEHIYGLFECDTIIRVPRLLHTVADVGEQGQKRRELDLIVNIEVDGLHHRMEKKRRFCALRDRYLQSRGVVIERIEARALEGMNDIALQQWVLDVTAKALILWSFSVKDLDTRCGSRQGGAE